MNGAVTDQEVRCRRVVVDLHKPLLRMEQIGVVLACRMMAAMRPKARQYRPRCCLPRTNTPCERFCFRSRLQPPTSGNDSRLRAALVVQFVSFDSSLRTVYAVSSQSDTDRGGSLCAECVPVWPGCLKPESPPPRGTNHSLANRSVRVVTRLGAVDPNGRFSR